MLVPQNTTIEGDSTSNETTAQCVVIEKGQPSVPPAPICSNDNSVRASSRRNRVYVLREFLFRTYQVLNCTPSAASELALGENNDSCHKYKPPKVLDVAGGRGDLSWGLRNIDGIDSVIADPRIPNLKRLNKSVKFLIDHPEEAAIRAVEGLPTHQPLAQLLPRLIKTCETNDNVVKLTAPRNLRLHVDDTLVETLRKALITCDENESHECLNVWNNYWEGERCRIESNKKVYGGTAPRNGVKKVDDSETRQIIDSREALEVFQLMDLIVGFHPDQATESTIDLALLLQVPFAVVPCCVFPKEFPNRTLDGKRVRSHGEFVDYLCLKHPQIRKEKLSFVETETGKNVVLYMTKEDFC